MSQIVYMICGVPGSGKTWVAKQLPQFNYVPHDDHRVDAYHNALIVAATVSNQPVLAEAPFRISVLIDQLQAQGIKVITYYITDHEMKIKLQYERRDNKVFPKQHITNLKRYNQRSWDHRGTAQEILNLLRGVK